MKPEQFNDTLSNTIDDSWFESDLNVDKNIYSKHMDSDLGYLMVTTIYGHIAKTNRSIGLFS